MSFVITFDIPREMQSETRQMNRVLHRIGARRLQHSVWRHNNLNELIEIGMRIRKMNGHAKILEEKFLF